MQIRINSEGLRGLHLRHQFRILTSPIHDPIHDLHLMESAVVPPRDPAMCEAMSIIEKCPREKKRAIDLCILDSFEDKMADCEQFIVSRCKISAFEFVSSPRLYLNTSWPTM